MPIPEFVVELRRKIGQDLLWMPGVTAVVFDAAGRVLLVRRADTAEWAPIGGILEPGEQPADCAVREVLEEAGVRVIVQRLVSVRSEPPNAYPNGDRVQFLDLTFRCGHLSGEPRPADDECLDAAWFELEDLPPMRERWAARIQAAVPVDAPVAFAVPEGE
jgi:ADP-ribose pyrophosphatase YjhB (NUDIX family)